MNRDEPTKTGDEQKDIVATAKAQAQKIIQRAEVEAKQILADAREKAGVQRAIAENRPRKWVYNHTTGESKIVERSFKKRGWHDHPKPK